MNNNQGYQLQYEFTSIDDMMLYAYSKGWLNHFRKVLHDMNVEKELIEILRKDVKYTFTLEGDPEDAKRFLVWVLKCTLDGKQFVDNNIIIKADYE